MFSWGLGIYESDFLAIHEDKRKRVKAIYALIHSSDLTVVNDCRFPDRISSIDQYLSLRGYFGISRGSFLDTDKGNKFPRTDRIPDLVQPGHD
jgi:hypothetical protein